MDHVRRERAAGPAKKEPVAHRGARDRAEARGGTTALVVEDPETRMRAAPPGVEAVPPPAVDRVAPSARAMTTGLLREVQAGPRAVASRRAVVRVGLEESPRGVVPVENRRADRAESPRVADRRETAPSA